MSDIFKTATRNKLRVSTTRGMLSVEQLWDLNLSDLDEIAVTLDSQVSKTATKTFLSKTTEKDKITKLMFDVVLEILKTKQTDQERALKAAETKRHNQKISELIAEKQDEELKNMSIEELEKMIK
jgi:hypothetical protein